MMDREPTDPIARLTAKFEAELAERRSIERELAHLASFAELDPNIILETDLEAKVLYQNIVAQDLFGDLRNSPKHPLLEDLSVFPEALRAENKTLHSRTVTIGDKTFNQLIMLVENRSRIRCYVTDITELKRVDQMKTDFVNMVSHELRTPLTSIQAVIRLLQAEVLGPINTDQKESLVMAVSSIDRLGRLINNLLDVSKIESGKMEMNRQWVDMELLLKEIGANFSAIARERGLEIRVEQKTPLPPLYMDRDKIIQVLTNLTQNAMKFTPKGSITLSADVDADGFTCQVADTGPGIPAAALSKLFGKFQQVGTQAVTAEKGTGLGLSVCKGLVELHGGKIWVESDEGHGARFIFRLPRLTPETIFRESVHQMLQNAAVTSRPLSVLLFSFKEWDSITAKLGATAADALMGRLDSMVRSESRQETDIVVRSDSQIWLAAVNADAVGAARIAERVDQNVQLPMFQEIARTPVSLQFHVTSYPENAELPEQILAFISSKNLRP